MLIEINMKKYFPLSLILVIFTLSTLVSAQVPSYLPTNGLVGWWPFNGNANDSSGYDNHMRISGATLTSGIDSINNSAFSFNGVSDYLVDTNPSFSFGEDSSFTVSVWMNPSSLNIGREIVNYGSLTGGNFVWLLDLYNGNLRFGCAKQQSNWYLAQYPVTNLTTFIWYNITGVYNNGSISLYLNGTLIANTTYNKSSANTIKLPLSFGSFYRGNGGNPMDFFHGKLDNIGIWNRVLSSKEIQLLFTRKQIVLPSNLPSNGLSGWWPFNNNALDESGNGNNGIVNGSTITSDRLTHSSSAYSFNGSSDYIGIPNNSTLSFDTNISISFWFNISSPNTGYMIDRDICGFSNDWSIYCDNQRINFRTGLSGSDQILSSDSILLNTWHHCAVVRNTTSIKLYIDNVIQNTLSVNSNAFTNNSLQIYFGDQVCNSNIAPNFSGKLDDIGIWNRALSDSEITKLFSYTNTGIEKTISNQQFHIYPNPTQGIVNIEGISVNKNHVVIYDSRGKEITKLTFSESRVIDLTSYESGLYIIKIDDNFIKVMKN